MTNGGKNKSVAFIILFSVVTNGMREVYLQCKSIFFCCTFFHHTIGHIDTSTTQKWGQKQKCYILLNKIIIIKDSRTK